MSDKTAFERTPWTDDGYAAPPEEKTAMGCEVIYRAYGGRSPRIGNCFFTPCVLGFPIVYWTRELLENELNAAMWGNSLGMLAKFQIRADVPYKIGPIAHDRYAGFEKEKDKEEDNKIPFDQYSFITPSGIFKQVTFFKNRARPWSDYIRDPYEDFPLKLGNRTFVVVQRASKYDN